MGGGAEQSLSDAGYPLRRSQSDFGEGEGKIPPIPPPSLTEPYRAVLEGVFVQNINLVLILQRFYDV